MAWRRLDRVVEGVIGRMEKMASAEAPAQVGREGGTPGERVAARREGNSSRPPRGAKGEGAPAHLKLVVSSRCEPTQTPRALPRRGVGSHLVLVWSAGHWSAALISSARDGSNAQSF